MHLFYLGIDVRKILSHHLRFRIETTFYKTERLLQQHYVKMAANVDFSSYNAVASPMHLFEDGELLTREELRKRKEEALVRQEKKSRILEHPKSF